MKATRQGDKLVLTWEKDDEMKPGETITIDMPDKEVKEHIYWSLDESHLYLQDEIEQADLITVQFSFDQPLTKEQKIMYLQAMIDTLTHKKHDDSPRGL